MTPKERVKAAMDLKTPDRIPVMCQMSIGHMLQQLPVSPVDFWFDADLFSDGLIRLREIYEFDGILISLHGHFPDWREKIESRRLVTEGEEVVLKNGVRMLFTNNELPQVLTDESERSGRLDYTVMDTDSILKTLPDSINYIPVSQGLRFDIDEKDKFRSIDKIIRKVGGEYSVHGEVTSAFDYYLDLVGHQEGLLVLVTEPEKAKAILEHFTGLLVDLAEEMCRTGVDAIKISSPFAGAGFISPEAYLEFVAPHDGRLARAITDKGVHAYIHTCGAISDRLQIMFDMGASGLECLDPPPLGNVELDDAVKFAKGKGFIKGNVDSVNVLLNGSDEEVLEDARRRLGIAKTLGGPGLERSGGFILSTACSIAPMVKREKILLLKEAVKRWG